MPPGTATGKQVTGTSNKLCESMCSALYQASLECEPFKLAFEHACKFVDATCTWYVVNLSFVATVELMKALL